MASRSSRPSIVVVDDDAALRAALSFALETEGLDVETFESAEAALAAAPTPRDCFVLDQRLPGMSGLDLLDHLRRRGETAPAVLITSNPGAATRARARASGIDIVEKPLLEGMLTRKILSLVETP